MTEKKKLRQHVLRKLSTLSSEEKVAIEKSFYEQLFASTLWEQAQTIGITYPQTNEWDTIPIMQRAWYEKKIVAIPKVNTKTKQMTFHLFANDTEGKIGAYGITEPKDDAKIIEKDRIDVLFVPGVVYDKNGYRIGYGGGFYDRFLQDYKHQTISLVSKWQLVDKVPKESHDIPVQKYIHEHSIYSV